MSNPKLHHNAILASGPSIPTFATAPAEKGPNVRIGPPARVLKTAFRATAFPGTIVPLLRQPLLERRPARNRLLQIALRVGRKGLAVLLERKKIKALAGHQPEPGLARDRNPPRQIDRVVTAELGAVNVGMGDKGRAV